MMTNIRKGTFHLATYILIFLFTLLHSCATTSTSYMRVEDVDFKNNLPGRWEGKWQWSTRSGPERIKISKIDGNKVHLTGFLDTLDWSGKTEEVYGRIENSTLLLSWPGVSGGLEEKYEMKRDDSNNLILDGHSKSQNFNTTVQLEKIE